VEKRVNIAGMKFKIIHEALTRPLRYLILVSLLYATQPAVMAESLTTIGWIERVRLLPEGFELQAKIDTGADNSSLDVLHWEAFQRGGKEWVRFELYNNGGWARLFERPLKRHVRIKGKEARLPKRPLVELWICVGDEKYLAPVNLAERGRFKYRMLVGRSFLKGRFLVDSGSKLTLSPQCLLSD